MTKYYSLAESECYVCHKSYIRPPGSIYAVRLGGKRRKCCSYKCYQILLAEKEKHKGGKNETSISFN